MGREYTSHASQTITSVKLVLVESGAIYTTVDLMLLCTYVASHNSAYILLACVSFCDCRLNTVTETEVSSSRLW